MRMRVSGFSPVAMAALAACGEGTTVAPSAEAPTILTAQGSRPTKGHPGSKIVESMAAPNPWGVAVRDDGLTFVSGTVSEIEVPTGNLLRTFTLGGRTQGLALNRKGTRLYVANESAYLSEIDLFSNQGKLGAITDPQGSITFVR